MGVSTLNNTQFVDAYSLPIVMLGYWALMIIIAVVARFIQFLIQRYKRTQIRRLLSTSLAGVLTTTNRVVTEEQWENGSVKAYKIFAPLVLGSAARFNLQAHDTFLGVVRRLPYSFYHVHPSCFRNNCQSYRDV